MDRISDDLLALILGFVPAETCIVARAVSKRWLSVIDAVPHLLRGLSRPRIVAEFYARCKYRPAEAPRFALRFGITAGEARADDNRALYIACVNGYLDLARWLVPTFGLTAGDALAGRYSPLASACSSGRLEMLRWLISTFRFSPGDARRSIALERVGMGAKQPTSAGCLAIVKLLAGTFGYTREDVRASKCLNWACRRGDLNIVKWLIGAFGLDHRDCCCGSSGPFDPAGPFDLAPLYAACIGGHLSIVRYLVSTFDLVTGDRARVLTAMSHARAHGQPDIVSFLAAEISLTAEEKRSCRF